MSLTDRPEPIAPELGEAFTLTAVLPDGGGYRLSIELAAGVTRELYVGGYLAEQIATIEVPDELPAILCLRAPEGESPWRFEYLGKPDPAHQLVEAVGADFGEPYTFDPSPHMDLGTAEPPSPIPPPAPPGPPPPPGAQTSPPNPVPPPARPLGSVGDQSVPFAH
jgi:hypothetical protein